MNYKFTIFTPTYNRRNQLRFLYTDLINQTFKDFEWLIVDDGSNDGTNELVNEWKKEGLINIEYIYKQNGGKHTAINMGVSRARGELFFLADSDDRILSDGIENIYKSWEELEDKSQFCGVTGLFQFENGNLVGSQFDNDHLEVPFSDLYYKYNVKGDKVVCFLTKILKKYPFPENKSIKFVMEAVVWDEISKDYKIKCVNNIIQIKEYYDDGITMNTYNLNNLRGLAFSYLNIINNSTWPFNKYRRLWKWQYINLVSHSLLVRDNYFNQIKKNIDKLMYLLFFVRGYIAFIRMKKFVDTE